MLGVTGSHGLLSKRSYGANKRLGLVIEMTGHLGGGLDGELGGAVEEVLAELVVVDVMFESEGEGLGDLLDVVGIELSAEGADDFGDGGGV